MAENKLEKIRIGWFTFSCCEDNTIMMTEIMNDHWQEWKKMFDFVHARVLQRNNRDGDLDIAFIEGAIASEKHAEEARKIRERSKLVVAVGSCAVTGMPSAQRNLFSEEQKREVEWLVARFASLEKVLKLADVVKVDAEVPGCPMAPPKFLEVVNAAVAQIREGK